MKRKQGSKVKQTPPALNNVVLEKKVTKKEALPESGENKNLTQVKLLCAVYDKLVHLDEFSRKDTFDFHKEPGNRPYSTLSLETTLKNTREIIIREMGQKFCDFLLTLVANAKENDTNFVRVSIARYLADRDSILRSEVQAFISTKKYAIKKERVQNAVQLQKVVTHWGDYAMPFEVVEKIYVDFKIFVYSKMVTEEAIETCNALMFTNKQFYELISKDPAIWRLRLICINGLLGDGKLSFEGKWDFTHHRFIVDEKKRKHSLEDLRVFITLAEALPYKRKNLIDFCEKKAIRRPFRKCRDNGHAMVTDSEECATLSCSTVRSTLPFEWLSGINTCLRMDENERNNRRAHYDILKEKYTGVNSRFRKLHSQLMQAYLGEF